MKAMPWLALAALLLAACGAPAPVEFKLQAADIKYDLKTFEAQAGRVVRLTFENTGALEHDFTIMEMPVVSVTEVAHSGTHDMGHLEQAPSVHVSAAADTTAVLEFTPTKPGMYEFACSVAGHKEAGMLGTLIVR